MAKTDKKDRKTFLLRLSNKVYDRVKKMSQKENRSLNAQIETILEDVTK